MTYTLYYAPAACSISPHTALREAGLPFELSRVDLGKKTYDGGAKNFLEVNPKGYVPALRVPDGRVITENVVMIQYIADQVPEKKLAPAPESGWERMRFAELLLFVTTELHKGLGPLYNPKANDELKAAVKGRLVTRFTYLASQIRGPYVLGEDFSVADGYLFYCLRAWKTVAKEPFPGDVLAGYYDRLLARPSIQAVLAAEKIEG